MTPIIDISPRISPRLAVFPGDTAFTREVLMDTARGDRITLSTTRATVHLGAHADAPSHYQQGGLTIDEQPLSLYVGPCELLRVGVGPAGRVRVEDLPRRPVHERVLLATGTAPEPEHWSANFAGIEPALVDALHQWGVRLVGIDTPSVDVADSKDLPAHARFAANDMAIIEGLVLRDVPEGVYELIALPLAIEGADASPVRAVLRRL